MRVQRLHPGIDEKVSMAFPEGPSTQYLRTPDPRTMSLVVFETRVLKCWVLGPSEFVCFIANVCLYVRTFTDTSYVRLFHLRPCCHSFGTCIYRLHVRQAVGHS